MTPIAETCIQVGPEVVAAGFPIERTLVSTLNDKQLAGLLQKLHHDAELTDSKVASEMEAAGVSMEQAAAQLIAKERDNYRALYGSYAGTFLAISQDYGRFLYAMARACKATQIVEFGTSMGISTLYLAAALRDNGGGRLIGSELESSKAAFARSNLEAAGLADLVEIREGDALETLEDVGGDINFAFLDGAWSLYLPVLKLIEPHLCLGALVLSENTFAEDYRAYVRHPVNGYIAHALAVDEGRGNEYAVRVG